MEAGVTAATVLVLGGGLPALAASSQDVWKMDVSSGWKGEPGVGGSEEWDWA